METFRQKLQPGKFADKLHGFHTIRKMSKALRPTGRMQLEARGFLDPTLRKRAKDGAPGWKIGVLVERQT